MNSVDMGYELIHSFDIGVVFKQYGVYHRVFYDRSYRIGVKIDDNYWISFGCRISESEYLLRKQLWFIYKGEEL